MSDAVRLVCEEKGHVPKDIDPTGGDPFIGGPVAITVCDRCGRELDQSDTAKAFNKAVVKRRKEIEAQELLNHNPLPPRWYQRILFKRVIRCSCGWSGHTFDIHRSAAAAAKAWSR